MGNLDAIIYECCSMDFQGYFYTQEYYDCACWAIEAGLGVDSSQYADANCDDTPLYLASDCYVVG